MQQSATSRGDSTTAPHPVLGQYYESEAERRPFVTTLFERAAPHYDWLGGVMSLGSQNGYRRLAGGPVAAPGLTPGGSAVAAAGADRHPLRRAADAVLLAHDRAMRAAGNDPLRPARGGIRRRAAAADRRHLQRIHGDQAGRQLA